MRLGQWTFQKNIFLNFSGVLISRRCCTYLPADLVLRYLDEQLLEQALALEQQQARVAVRVGQHGAVGAAAAANAARRRPVRVGVGVERRRDADRQRLQLVPSAAARRRRRPDDRAPARRRRRFQRHQADLGRRLGPRVGRRAGSQCQSGCRRITRRTLRHKNK